MKKYYILVILTLFSVFVKSQNVNDYLFHRMDKTSNVKLNSYDFTNTNLFSGKIDLNIPIYEIKDGNISVPIVLSYDNGGIKVDEIASNVGTGWTLSAGGQITREIKGIEDNEISYQGLFNRAGGTRGYNHVDTKLKYQEIPNEPEGLREPMTIDSSPDIFTMNAVGDMAKFILNLTQKPAYGEDEIGRVHNAGAGFSAEFIDNSGYKAKGVNRFTVDEVSKQFFIGFSASEFMRYFYPGTSIPSSQKTSKGLFDYKSFNIKNTSGIEYEFKDLEYYESIPAFLNKKNYNITRYDSVSGIAIPQTFPANHVLATGPMRTRVSKWKLSKITDEQRQNSVKFDYESYAMTDGKLFTSFFNDAVFLDKVSDVNTEKETNGCYFGFLPNFLDKEPHLDYTDIEVDKYQLLMRKNTRSQRLKKIEWEYGKVEFEYDHIREDAINEKALTMISVYDNYNKLVKKISLKYFYGNSKERCSSWECKRLFLKEIIQHSIDNKEQIVLYKFDYNLTKPIPKFNTEEHDFLGFYNENGIEKNDELNIKKPILYYKENFTRPDIWNRFTDNDNRIFDFNSSVLPFNPIKKYDYKIDGDYSLEANDNSLIGTLIKVSYPTGGSTEYVYENNTFLYDSQIIKAGGARIFKQIMRDKNNSILKEVKYEYEGGNLFNIPVFGSPYIMHYQDKNKIAFTVHNKRRNKVIHKNGSEIGYSKVREKSGNGYLEYSFDNTVPKNDLFFDYTNYTEGTIKNSVCTSLLHLATYLPHEIDNNDYGNYLGRLNSIATYNENGQKIKNEFFGYRPIARQEKLIKTSYSFKTGINRVIPYRRFSKYRRNYDRSILEYESKISYQRNYLLSKGVEYFSPDNPNSNKGVFKAYSYVYDHNFPLIKTSREYSSHLFKQLEEDKAFDYEYTYEYPFDCTDNSFCNALSLQNRVSEPIKSITKNEKNILKSTYTKFNYFNSKLMKSEIMEKKGSNQFEDSEDLIIAYDQYDSKGNLTQYTLKNGIPVTIIWGYDGQYPVVKLEGVTYTDVNPNTINALKSSINDDELLNKIEELRNIHTDAQITGYLYKPLIGLSKIITPNGLIEYYIYDNYNRLKEIHKNNELIESFEYNYAKP